MTLGIITDIIRLRDHAPLINMSYYILKYSNRIGKSVSAIKGPISICENYVACVSFDINSHDTSKIIWCLQGVERQAGT